MGDVTPLAMDSAMATETTPYEDRLNIGDGIEQYHHAIIDVIRPYV